LSTPASAAQPSSFYLYDWVIPIKDDSAFKAQVQDRISGRGQNLFRGTALGPASYRIGGGNFLDFGEKSSDFPNGQLRVVLQIDTTATYYPVYDHTNKRLVVYDALGNEVSDETDLSAVIFPFVAVGD